MHRLSPVEAARAVHTRPAIRIFPRREVSSADGHRQETRGAPPGLLGYLVGIAVWATLLGSCLISLHLATADLLLHRYPSAQRHRLHLDALASLGRLLVEAAEAVEAVEGSAQCHCALVLILPNTRKKMKAHGQMGETELLASLESLEGSLKGSLGSLDSLDSLDLLVSLNSLEGSLASQHRIMGCSDSDF